MNVYKFDKQINKSDLNFFKTKSILLLGEFELFHIGHSQLLKKAKEIKNNSDKKIGIFIIDNDSKKYIQTIDDRLYLLAQIGFDFAVVAKFNFEFKSMNGADFINKLIKQYHVSNFVCGQDFHFGNNRNWKGDDIKNIIDKKNIDIDIVEIKKANNQKISTRIIKEMYEYGEFNEIKKILPNFFYISVEIKNKIINWNDNLIKPHFGIYYFKIALDGYWYSGLIHFNINNQIFYKLINDQNLYNIFNQETKIQIIDLERIIFNKRFDLIENQDIDNAMSFFSE